MNLHDLKKIMPDIFDKVKKDVRNVYNRHRAGLSLGLVEMGMFQQGFIGGMHFHPGTEIVMNKTPLKLILETQPPEVVWAYTYHILLHEYIHSLGVINEHQCREITLKITEDTFKDSGHPAIILAKKGIGAYLPELKMLYIPPEQKPEGMTIEYVYGFDRESQTYFS
ncbi:MAG: hypothetical protein EU531_01520 [Promethearchaeota archaeon]|nr:MAG: hypothetical protein EU531_01520 [Candidatus Lokiarchaeota archaeon]